MTLSGTELPNARAKLLERIQAGHITWVWPIIVVFARLLLAVLAQALVAGLFMLRGHPNPWEAAAPWWTVYGTLIDVGCLVLLAWLACKEGIRLSDLFNFQRQHLGRDLLLGLGFVVLFIVLTFVGGMIFGPLIYGATPAPAVMVPLPLLGTWYSVLIWPIIWAIAEELTYQGYSLPRIEVLSGRGWLAIIIVGFGWALQHSALPLMSDWRWAAYRFGSSLLIAIVLPILYLRVRRLLPFIIAHWAADLISVVMVVLLPPLTL
ncbi:MAG: CPBP family intramembrane metalloprotease [Anaerolineales bacterium]|jgi:membrane protease YdiL (CAAX protease family)